MQINTLTTCSFKAMTPRHSEATGDSLGSSCSVGACGKGALRVEMKNGDQPPSTSSINCFTATLCCSRTISRVSKHERKTETARARNMGFRDSLVATWNKVETRSRAILKNCSSLNPVSTRSCRTFKAPCTAPAELAGSLRIWSRDGRSSGH